MVMRAFMVALVLHCASKYVHKSMSSASTAVLTTVFFMDFSSLFRSLLYVGMAGSKSFVR